MAETIAQILILFLIIVLVAVLYTKLLDYLGKGKSKEQYINIKEAFVNKSGRIRIMLEVPEKQHLKIHASQEEGTDQEVFSEEVEAETEQLDFMWEGMSAGKVELIFETKNQRIKRILEA